MLSAARACCLLIATASLGVALAAAGTLRGTVRAEGVELPSEGGGAGAYGSRRYKFADRIDYDRLRDFVVYIDQEVPGAPPAPKDPIAVVTQKDAMFAPHVLPVAAGTTVTWPNRDDIYHNVFSMSDAASFDLGLYQGEDESKRVTFSRPGRVDVFCAIHSNMHCIVLVVPNSFFALTDARGRFAIPGVPPGTYTVRAWHERVPAKVMTVTVPPDGDATVDFVLGFAGPAAP